MLKDIKRAQNNNLDQNERDESGLGSGLN